MIDNTYIEYALYSLWRINILELIRIKATLSKQFHIQPSEIDKMCFWEYEYYVKFINEAVKEENNAQQDQINKSGVGDISHIMKNLNKPSSPKLPSNYGYKLY